MGPENKGQKGERMSKLTMWEEMKSGLYDFTEGGKCSNCGQCCSNYLPISKHEVETIKRYIEKHGIKEIKRFSPAAKPPIDMVCPFRSDTEKRCTIYPVRPAICRDFQCDKPRKNIMADKAMYHGKYDVVDMRAEFFGGETGLKDLLRDLGLM